MRRIGWGLFVAAGLAGCVSQGPIKAYDGPAQPEGVLAELAVPAVIDIATVDGRDLPGRLAGGHPERVQLSAGEHVLTLRYVDVFKARNGDDDIVRSRVMALRFTAAAGGRYDMPFDAPKDEDSARHFANDPHFQLRDTATGATNAAVAIKSLGEASLLDTLKSTLSGAGETPHPSADSSNLQLLKDVWSRTSAADQAAFRAWLDGGAKPAP